MPDLDRETIELSAELRIRAQLQRIEERLDEIGQLIQRVTPLIEKAEQFNFSLNPFAKKPKLTP